MELTEAIQHALEGNAVLFVGAGFSIGATNTRDGRLKNGRDLRDHLLNMAGIALDEDVSLQDAADLFLEVHSFRGPDLLMSELQHEFTAKGISPSQKQIARIPWRRVYTTNYDDVVEKAYSQVSRSIRPVVLSDDVRSISHETATCVHLNGFVGRLSRQSLQSELKLTESSYVTASIVESEWAVLFRNDIRMARAVFFIGYSASDLDIRRILFESDELREKCFFVLGKTIGPSTRRKVKPFGSLLEIDDAEFALALTDAAKGFSPIKPSGYIGHALQKYDPSKSPVIRHATDEDVLTLLLQGRLDTSLIQPTVDTSGRYYLLRDSVREVADDLVSGNCVVVNSEMANGKTMVVEGVKRLCHERGLNVFFVSGRSGDVLGELQQAVTLHSAGVFVVENYVDWLDFIGKASYYISPSFSFLFTARTSVNDSNIDALSEKLPSREIIEHNVDKLSDIDLRWLASMFDEYGFWADKASWSEQRKLDYLRKSCHSRFQQVI